MSIFEEGPLYELNKFGLRLRDWVIDLLGMPALRKALGFIPGSSSWFTLFDRIKAARQWLLDNPSQQNRAWDVFINTVLSGELPDSNNIRPALKDLYEDPNKFFEYLLTFSFTSGPLRDTFETLGTVIYDTSVSAITGKGAPVNSEAADRARAFVGYVTALGAMPNLISEEIEVGSLGQIDKLGDNIQNVYWNLGLGFLTWQVMAPILQAAILEPLQIDVQRQYRGKRFTRAEYQDLFALGKIDLDQLKDGLKDEGWRDADIEAVIDLSYAPLGRGDIIDLWHKGIWTPEQAAEALRRNGIKPENVELIMKLENKEDVANDRTESIAVLGTSFEDGLLPEADFRAALKSQNYTEREIDLRIQLIRFRQADKARKLSVGQLKQAWSENVVGDQEVLFRLGEEDYAPTEAKLVLDTWKAELAPDFLRVNQGTILEMYRYGIFDRKAALDRLQSIGYNADDAEAQVRLTEAKFPETFGGAPPRKQRLLTLGAVVDLYAMGRINDDDLKLWADQSGFSERDAQGMVTLIKEQAKAFSRPLSQSTIEDAYITGVFDRKTASDALQAIGFTPDDSEIVLKTLEAGNPAVFSPGSVTSVRQPTIGALVTAVQSGFISEIEFYQKAALIGFNREGAQLYLENSRARLTKGTKKLTKADVLEFFRKNLMDYPSAYNELTDMGYSARDADLLLRSEQKGVTSTDIWSAMLSGYLDPQSAAIALLGMGFTEDEVTEAFASIQQ